MIPKEAVLEHEGKKIVYVLLSGEEFERREVTVGDELGQQSSRGFTMQSILKRVPIVIAPIAGGALMASLGVLKGIHVALLITFVLALITMILVSRLNVTLSALHATSLVGVWRMFHTALKRLLVSDVIIRTCEGISGVLTILYGTTVQPFSIAQYGTLIAIQMVTSILVYIPAGKIADRVGRKPFVIITFLSFAFFPLAVIAASNYVFMIFAFVVGGLRKSESLRVRR